MFDLKSNKLYDPWSVGESFNLLTRFAGLPHFSAPTHPNKEHYNTGLGFTL